ncbi:MAG: hypothetical protein OEW09_16795, partial [Anaerolineae bacterium]|nr:hypothetical protein [Anaerolineae bacterium]
YEIDHCGSSTLTSTLMDTLPPTSTYTLTPMPTEEPTPTETATSTPTEVVSALLRSFARDVPDHHQQLAGDSHDGLLLTDVGGQWGWDCTAAQAAWIIATRRSRQPCPSATLRTGAQIPSPDNRSLLR